MRNINNNSSPHLQPSLVYPATKALLSLIVLFLTLTAFSSFISCPHEKEEKRIKELDLPPQTLLAKEMYSKLLMAPMKWHQALIYTSHDKMKNEDPEIKMLEEISSDQLIAMDMLYGIADNNHCNVTKINKYEESSKGVNKQDIVSMVNKSDLTLNACPNFSPCDGLIPGLSFCSHGNWNEDGSHKYVSHSAIYHLPQPILFYRAHVFKKSDVFISTTGLIFDKNYHYYHGGCSFFERKIQVNINREGKRSLIRRFDDVIVMLSAYPNNFFHTIIEIAPSILQLLPIIQQNPNIPILMNRELKSPEIFRYFGLDERKLNTIFIRKDDSHVFYYAKNAIFTSNPPCHFTTRGLWKSIRQNFFQQTKDEIISMEPSLGVFPLPKDKTLRLIFVNRTGERELVNSKVLFDLIIETFPEIDLVVYDSMSFPASVNLFSQAHMLLGVHGAGLSNMIYMPEESTVIEILPGYYQNYCFYNLARTLGFKHILIDGKGTKSSPTTTQFELIIQAIQKTLEKKQINNQRRI